ncbi:MAG: NfeD family protein [Crocosphaera sp.]|nr:NfeD family protein [Crocosphaera sp.]
MNFLDYPYRTLYGIVKQKISSNITGTVELLDKPLIQANLWSAQSLTDKIIEPGTKIYVVSQNHKILVVEPLCY